MFEPSMLLCRLCRKSSGPYIDIFNPKGTRGLVVWKVIKDLIQLDMSKDDMLPHTICHKCMDKVVEFRNFKTMCISSRIEFLKASACVGLVEAESVGWLKEVEERVPVVVSGAVDSKCAVFDDGLPEVALDSGDPLHHNAEEQEVFDTLEADPVVCGRGSNSSENSVFCVSGDVNSLCLTPSHTPEPKSTAERQSRKVNEVSSSINVGLVSVEEVEQVNASNTRESTEDFPRRYLDRRLDEGIGSLKACDMPNCRKVFSTYKALVIHKRARHKDLSGEEKDKSVIGSPVKIASNSQGEVDNSLSQLSEKIGTHIAEFECSFPSCGMKFSNLSFLLDHQTTHPQPKDVDGEPPALEEPECTKEEVNGGKESDCPAASSSIPEEPEFLCHASGCGRAFFTYSRLLRHRKVAHSKKKVRRVESVPKDEGKPPSDLRCSTPDCGKEFSTMRNLLDHRRTCEGANHEAGSRSQRGKLRKRGDVNVAEQKVVKKAKKGVNVVLKEEPLDKREEPRAAKQGPSVNNNVEDEVFECQFSNCPKMFASFRQLVTHVTRVHGYKKT